MENITEMVLTSVMDALRTVTKSLKERMEGLEIKERIETV